MVSDIDHFQYRHFSKTLIAGVLYPPVLCLICDTKIGNEID